MNDPLGVSLYRVGVGLPAGPAKHKALRKLDEMQRELDHLRAAVKKAMNAIAGDQQRELAGAVMDSRNWTLSLLESHAYLHSMCYAKAASQVHGNASPYFFDMLASRAVKLGSERGRRDA